MADRLAGGDLSARMRESDTAEIGALERSLNVMAGSLEQIRDELASLLAEQAALRRVATLVARGAAPADVFAVTATEVCRLLDTDATALCRYGPDATGTVLALETDVDLGIRVGERITLEGESAMGAVFRTGRAARQDGFERTTGAVAGIARKGGMGTSVGAPIVVEDRLWGVVIVSSRGRALAADIEQRLGDFTELVATAIANTEARTEVGRLVDEQAALRRVATLVARGAPPEELFAAVVEELGRVFPGENGALARYESDGAMTAVAISERLTDSFPVGSRWPLGGKNISTVVAETGRSARSDSYDDASGRLGTALRDRGFVSSVGAPIVVEGRVWGMLSLASTEQPLPADTETRLASFAELVATAIANAEARTEVAASRARIVAATDDERRRVVRDLHDGAQQRLVHTIITLKLAARALAHQQEDGPELVREALDHAEGANVELRELAHGILPAVLHQGGLRAGVDALGSRMPVPVEMDVNVGRLPAAVEATAYFIVAEALTNVVKHAEAESGRVTAAVDDGSLRIDVSDDGRGGADASRGSGLVGLADRVAAGGGTMAIASPPGAGTTITVTLPLNGSG
jgi:signal transduction histidine kinase